MDIEVKSVGVGIAAGVVIAFVIAKFWKAIVRGTTKTFQKIVKEVKETPVETPPAQAKASKS